MGLMALVCTLVVIGAMLLVVYLVDRVVEAVQDEVDPASSSSTVSSPAQLGRQLLSSATADDVTADWAAAFSDG
jgi:hypothetical protein